MTLSPNHQLNLKNGVFDATTAADLAELFDTYTMAGSQKPLVVYFHGGLNSQPVALATAEERLLGQYQQAGAYPVFFIWQSGLREVLQHNLAAIFKEKIYQRLLSRVSQFVEAKLRQGERSERGERLELKSLADINQALQAPPGAEPLAQLDPSRLPPGERLREAEEAQFKEILKRDQTLTTEAQAIANTLRTEAEIAQDRAARSTTVPGSRHTLMSPEVLDRIRREAPTPAERGLVSTTTIILGAVRVLGRVIRRLAQGRDHGVYSTIVEEILREFYLANAGKLVWDWMKQDTLDAFGPDPARHGGTAFLEQLKTHIGADPPPRIILVGHSTGAIYICHFLAQAAHRLPPAVQFEVIFLAPACDFKLWSDTLTLYGDRIRAFRLFGMADPLEATDRLVPLVLVYPRSLLYFVSGVLEDEADKPLVGMERYYSGRPPYDAQAYPEIENVRRFIATEPGRLVWAETDGGLGLASAAKKHGDFDDADGPTIASVQHIIREGFQDGQR